VRHTSRNRKTGRKNVGRRFTEAHRTSQTAVYPHIAGALRHSNSNFQAIVVVGYFCWSSFRMDEGNPLSSKQALWLGWGFLVQFTPLLPNLIRDFGS